MFTHSIGGCSVWVCCIWPLSCLSEIKLSLTNLIDFYYEVMLNVFECFLYTCGDNHTIFSLHSFDVMHYVYFCVHDDPSLHPWNNFSLSMENGLFSCVVRFNLLLFHFLSQLCSSDVWFSVYGFLVWCVLFMFWYQALWNEFGSIGSLLNPWISLRISAFVLP